MFHWFNHSRRNFQSYIKSADAPLRKRYMASKLGCDMQQAHSAHVSPPLELRLRSCSEVWQSWFGWEVQVDSL